MRYAIQKTLSFIFTVVPIILVIKVYIEYMYKIDINNIGMSFMKYTMYTFILIPISLFSLFIFIFTKKKKRDD